MSVLRLKNRIDELEAVAGAAVAAVRVFLVREGEDAAAMVAAASLSPTVLPIVVRLVSARTMA